MAKYIKYNFPNPQPVICQRGINVEIKENLIFKLKSLKILDEITNQPKSNKWCMW